MTGEHDGPGEWKVRAGALPVALVLALVFHSCETGHFVQRTALTMPLHELGHAVTAWWCGFAAVPTLWRTIIPDSRGLIAPVVVAAVNLGAIWRGWTTDRRWLVGLGLVLGVVQVIGLDASADEAATAFTFGGDAGAMILGTGLMLLFVVGGPDSKLRAGGLRYGLLGIGAAGLVDTFAVWWSARDNPAEIPYGEIERVGLSDPSKLHDVHGWTSAEIVDNYVFVGICCGVVLVAIWSYATWSSWRIRESDPGQDSS